MLLLSQDRNGVIIKSVRGYCSELIPEERICLLEICPRVTNFIAEEIQSGGNVAALICSYVPILN